MRAGGDAGGAARGGQDRPKKSARTSESACLFSFLFFDPCRAAETSQAQGRPPRGGRSTPVLLGKNCPLLAAAGPLGGDCPDSRMGGLFSLSPQRLERGRARPCSMGDSAPARFAAPCPGGGAGRTTRRTTTTTTTTTEGGRESECRDHSKEENGDREGKGQGEGAV